MLYQEYDSEHRQIHYGLCWIVGAEDEIVPFKFKYFKNDIELF